LCFWFVQMTRTTPCRFTILHLSQIRFTEALTFICSVLNSTWARTLGARVIRVSLPAAAGRSDLVRDPGH
jgi:hypothetical protein